MKSRKTTAELLKLRNKIKLFHSIQFVPAISECFIQVFGDRGHPCCAINKWYCNTHLLYRKQYRNIGIASIPIGTHTKATSSHKPQIPHSVD